MVFVYWFGVGVSDCAYLPAEGRISGNRFPLIVAETPSSRARVDANSGPPPSIFSNLLYIISKYIS
jgi:hypothetical protein